jgi:hypothetical protein
MQDTKAQEQKCRLVGKETYAGPIIEARHKKKGVVTVHGVRMLSERRWVFMCKTSKGKLCNLMGDAKFWNKRDFASIIRGYPEPSAIIRQALKYNLPPVFNYDRFLALLQRARKYVATNNKGFGADLSISPMDQDFLVDVLESSPGTFDRSDGVDAEVSATRHTDDGESSAAWDEASTEERFSKDNPAAVREFEQEFIEEAPEVALDPDEHTPADYVFTPSNNAAIRDAFDVILARSPIQRKLAAAPNPDAEVLTAAQHVARSRKGDYIEMYLLFQEGEKLRDIGQKFFKIQAPTAGSPRSWPCLVPLEIKEVRASINYVRRWLQRLPNPANFLFEVQEELKRVNKDRIWAELSRKLNPPKPPVPESECPPDKKQIGSTIDNIRISGGRSPKFNLDKYFANLFAIRYKTPAKSSESLTMSGPMTPEDRVEFWQEMSDRLQLNAEYWVGEDGVVKSSIDNLPDPRSIPRKEEFVTWPTKTLAAPTWVPEVNSVLRQAAQTGVAPGWLAKIWPILARESVPAKPTRKEIDRERQSRKIEKLRILDAGFVALLDGPTPPREKTRETMYIILEKLGIGWELQEIADHLELSVSSVKGFVAQMKKASPKISSTSQ